MGGVGSAADFGWKPSSNMYDVSLSPPSSNFVSCPTLYIFMMPCISPWLLRPSFDLPEDDGMRGQGAGKKTSEEVRGEKM